MADEILEILRIAESILAWGLATSIFISTLLIYIFFTYTKSREKHLLIANKEFFLMIGLFMLDMSIMPLLLISYDLTTKRYFEFAGTVIMIPLAYYSYKFLKDIINLHKKS